MILVDETFGRRPLMLLGWSPHEGDQCPYQRDFRELPSLLQYVKIQPENQKGALTQPCWHLDLEFQPSELEEINIYGL